MFSSERTIAEFRGPIGIPVQIHSSMVLLLLIFVSFFSGLENMIYDAIFVVVLIGSIFLHELGHGWGCKVQGVPVSRIVLYGGGGFCEFSRSATQSELELIVPMGPIVNFTIWALASLALPYVKNGDVYFILSLISWVNLWLGLFNLLPVFPLDGGSILHLILCRLMPVPMATRIAGGIGLVVSLLMIPAMIYSFVMLGIVLFFFPSIPTHWRLMRGETA